MSKKRRYTKSIKFYISHVFGKWKPTTWVFFVLAIVSLLGVGKLVINFVNIGNLCIFCEQDNRVTRVTYVPKDFIPPKNYREVKLSFQISEEEKKFKEKVDYGNVKFYIDYTKEYFVIPNYKPWGKYTFGYCNNKLTDCFVYDRYNLNNYKEEEIYYEVIIKNFNPDDEEINDFWFEPTEFSPKQKITTLIFNINDFPSLSNVLLVDKYNNKVYFESLQSMHNVIYGLYDTETNEAYIEPYFRCEKQPVNTLTRRKNDSDYKFMKLQKSVSCEEALNLIKTL